MKKNLILLVALLTTMAFAGTVMAQGQRNRLLLRQPRNRLPLLRNRRQRAKAEMKEAVPQAMKASGTVAAYEAGKVIKVKDKDKEMAFDVTGNTQVKGEVKDGAKVTVMYKKEGDKMVATAITVVPRKRVEKKKPAPTEKKS